MRRREEPLAPSPGGWCSWCSIEHAPDRHINPDWQRRKRYLLAFDKAIDPIWEECMKQFNEAVRVFNESYQDSE
jgi:hypothetical protein